MGIGINITEEALKFYIDVFHRTLEETAKKYIPGDFQQLLHISLLPAEITCYVSTQFGVGFEYKSAFTTTIKSIRSSGRIEDLLLRTPRNISKMHPFITMGGANSSFTGATFTGMFPFRFANEKASLRIINTHFEANDWTRDIDYAEVYGNRKSEEWTEAMAISRAKDEVLAAMTEIGRANALKIPIHEYIAHKKEKNVLLLGKYDVEGCRRLDIIKESLIKLGYNPLLVKDVPDDPYQDLNQKVTLLGGLSRFVVVDDSVASGHIAELSLCEKNNWVTLILQKEGKNSNFMTASLPIYSTVIKSFAYELPSIFEIISDSTQWAETTLSSLQKQTDAIYPWRGLN